MRVFTIVAKILIFLLASIGGILFGVIVPAFLIFGDLINRELADHHVFFVWIVMGFIGYIVPAVLFILGRPAVSLIFSLIGSLLCAYIHLVFSRFNNEGAEITAWFMYLPQLFVTGILIFFIIIKRAVLSKEEKNAPSIFD
ncbi:MAG: hypothetical protein LBR74_07530 [Eubacterium sp.]|jgi:hypothetical protein|nr:hypothetical protein [Eubacterium sp.]